MLSEQLYNNKNNFCFEELESGDWQSEKDLLQIILHAPEFME